MTTYFKATRPDGTDFRTGTVKYEVGKTTVHPTSKKKTVDDPSTYLSVSTVATDCTGMSWPARLFVVEGIGQATTASGLSNKRCLLKVKVVEERPAWEVFGPQGQDVVAVIERAKVLTVDEAKALRAARGAAWDAAWYAARGAAWDAARDAAWYAAWDAARDAARDAAWYAAWDAARDAARGAAWDAARDAAWYAAWDAARDAARDATWYAAWYAALAFLTRDLITADYFTTLHSPWASVIK